MARRKPLNSSSEVPVVINQPTNQKDTTMNSSQYTQGTDNFEGRKIFVLEAPKVRYQDSKFGMHSDVILTAPEISGNAKVLWMFLDKCAGDNRDAFAGQEYLAKHLNTSTDSIKRWTKELETTGWLVKINRTASSNKYFLAIPAEHDVLASDYNARLSTVGQELARSKRSTKTHKGNSAPMHKGTDALSIGADMHSHKCKDAPIDKGNSAPLKRQSIKETELETNRAIKEFVVQSSRDTDIPLVETNTAFGGKVTEIDFSSGETECGSAAKEVEIEVVSSPGRFDTASGAISSPVVLVEAIGAEAPQSSPTVLADVVTAIAAPTVTDEKSVFPATVTTPTGLTRLNGNASGVVYTTAAERQEMQRAAVQAKIRAAMKREKANNNG